MSRAVFAALEPSASVRLQPVNSVAHTIAVTVAHISCRMVSADNDHTGAIRFISWRELDGSNCELV